FILVIYFSIIVIVTDININHIPGFVKCYFVKSFTFLVFPA
ncbi:hypothetical protein CLOBOL_06869, partial [Enterocloster bolteae ATCC BAA-613]